MSNLIDQYKTLHANEEMYVGDSTRIHKDFIGQYIDTLRCETILDFGCGKGEQYHKQKIHETNFHGIMPTLYDPAVEEYSTLPEGSFDAVISTDVLEHIDEDNIDSVLELIYSKANKFVYHGIANFPAAVTLSDGRNAHVIQQPIDWWIDKILPYADVMTMVYVYDNKHSAKAILQHNQVKMKKQK